LENKNIKNNTYHKTILLTFKIKYEIFASIKEELIEDSYITSNT